MSPSEVQPLNCSKPRLVGIRLGCGSSAARLLPEASATSPAALPPDTLGLHRVMFAVDDLDETLARLRPHGAELLGEVADYEGTYRLCCVRGPAGIIVALAQQIG